MVEGVNEGDNIEGVINCAICNFINYKRLQAQNLQPSFYNKV